MKENADVKYNGWTNYPTWAVWFWLMDDPPCLRWADTLGRARRALGLQRVGTGSTSSAAEDARIRLDRATWHLAEWLQDFVRQRCDAYPVDCAGAHIVAGLFEWAFKRVCWNEIAGRLIDAALEESDAAPLPPV